MLDRGASKLDTGNVKGTPSPPLPSTFGVCLGVDGRGSAWYLGRLGWAVILAVGTLMVNIFLPNEVPTIVITRDFGWLQAAASADCKWAQRFGLPGLHMRSYMHDFNKVIKRT